MAKFPLRGLLLALAIVGFIVFIVAQGNNRQAGQTKPLSTLLQQAAGGKVASVYIRDNLIRVNLLDPESDGYHTRTPIPLSFDEIQRYFVNKGIAVTVEQSPINWRALLFTMLPILLLIGFLWYMTRGMRSGGDGALQFGKSRARMISEDAINIFFKDVAGCDEAKEDLQEVVEFLKNPQKFHALGARIPHGVLMVGPPGSGKTYLAKAVAGEAKVPFFSLSGSDFVEMFVGVGAARVRDLFDTAKKSAPCIVFIDEIDAVGRRRGVSLNGGNDEREQTLNALLVEMDGFESRHDIIIVAATNRPDVLDPALLRPGRFDRQVVVDAPDVKGREEILRIHAADKPLASHVDLKTVAKRTPGFVGADLENVLNEAALVAARQGKTRIHPEDLDEAADRVVMGPARRSRVISAEERKLTAYHEAGHAIAAHFLEHANPVHKITIVPRGRAGGFMMNPPSQDLWYKSRHMLLDEIAVALAGRAAEELIFDDVTTGAQSDFQYATQNARYMVTRWGMSAKLGKIALSENNNSFLGDYEAPRLYSEDTAKLIDEEIKLIIDGQYGRAMDLLKEHHEVFERVAGALLEHETLHAEDFLKLIRGESLEDLPSSRNNPKSSPPTPKPDSEDKPERENRINPRMFPRPG
ncbi:MAG: ATP-dependent zinc metalloprotease FtsH [Deinococcales bacterium]